MSSSLRSRALRRAWCGAALCLVALAACDAPDEPVAELEPLRPLQLLDRGPEVRELHDYLARYGYFPNPELGRTCTPITEGSEPAAHTWHDNYLCTTANLGIRWSSAGPIAGMRCTQITEGAEPAAHTWHDNYLCVPNDSSLRFSWSSAGPIGGKTCTQWDEGSDPHTWMDNFLCY